MHVFCIYLRTNSDLYHLQHKLIGFYNADEKCLQRGTDWVFKYSGLRFICKGLIESCTEEIRFVVCYVSFILKLLRIAVTSLWRVTLYRTEVRRSEFGLTFRRR